MLALVHVNMDILQGPTTIRAITATVARSAHSIFRNFRVESFGDFVDLPAARNMTRTSAGAVRAQPSFVAPAGPGSCMDVLIAHEDAAPARLGSVIWNIRYLKTRVGYEPVGRV